MELFLYAVSIACMLTLLGRKYLQHWCSSLDHSLQDEKAGHQNLVYPPSHHLATLEQQTCAADRELALMRHAPCEGAPAAQAYSKVVGCLHLDGVVQMANVLPVALVRALASRVDQLLAKELSASDSDKSMFGNVLGRFQRYDLKLDIQVPAVKLAIDALLPKMGPPLARLLGSHPELYELAALVSDPGAPRQQVHSDTDWATRPIAFTCFVALQDISHEMGPTVFLPRTHTCDAHEDYNSSVASDMDDLLSTAASRVGLLRAGDCIIFDSRLMHCASANTSCSRRTLFYFSFRRQHGAQHIPGTILQSLAGKFSLDYRASSLQPKTKLFGLARFLFHMLKETTAALFRRLHPFTSF
eukprot:1359522-Pleurochrysis_carterae.AAC.1